jgi:hypothetical protein
MKIWIAITMLCVSAVAFPQNSTAVALHRISSTQFFAFGGIGVAGETSDGEKDFKVIMSLPPADAIIAFEKLYAAGNLQARSYALAGIRKLDTTRFNDLLLSLRGSSATVRTESGCIVETIPLRKVAMDLDAGRYDLWIR